MIRPTYMKTIAATLATGLVISGAAYAQTLNDPAQLQREHERAVAAHDPANDPFNPHSANVLNRQQLERARALGNGPGVTDDSYRVPYDTTSQAAKPPVAYNSDDEPMNAPSNDALPPPNTNSPSSYGQPDTNPQSSGTPSTDTPVTQTVDK